MKTVLLYRPNSEHETLVTGYLRDFKMRTGKDLPTLDVDSPEGSQLCDLYEIMQYPAILVTDDNGVMQNLWIGEPMPKFDEVSYYVDGSVPRV
jgi:hypothetical protein